MSLNIDGHDFKVEGRLIRIARLDGESFKFLDRPEVAVESLRDGASRLDLFTFVERLTESTPKYGYRWEWDNLAVLTISSFDTWWNTQVGNKTRNMVRQAARKGVTVREVAFDEALVNGITDIYNECPIRQGKRFPHFGKDTATVYNEAGTFLESSIFIGAFLDQRLIGFAKLTTDNTTTQAGLMHILSLVEHRDKAITNAIIAQAVRSCAERKIAYLVYASFSYGNKHRDSLSDFKKHNGFVKVGIPRYYVPLSRFGSFALRLHLHQTRLVDYFPEAVIAGFRRFRSAWYARRC